MKLVFFRMKRSEGWKPRRLGAGIERILFLSFIAAFLLLVMVQAALMNPEVRTFLTVDSQLEGTPLGAEEYLYNEGELALELVGEDGNSELKVLINGKEVAAFTSNVMNIRVKDGDVVEIDGSSIKDGADIRVASKSENISSDCIGQVVRVQANVRKLLKVKID